MIHSANLAVDAGKDIELFSNILPLSVGDEVAATQALEKPKNDEANLPLVLVLANLYSCF